MLPTPHLIHVRRWQQGGDPNPHGYRPETYGDPEELLVHGYAPGSSSDSTTAGRDTASTLVTVYAPAGTVIGYRDRAVIDGVEYEVAGNSKDYTSGPWANPAAGVVLELKRLEG